VVPAIVFLTIAAVVALLWHPLFSRDRIQEVWEASLSGVVAHTQRPTQRQNALQAIADFLNRPEIPLIVQRWSLGLPIAIFLLTAITQIWAFAVLIPIGFFAPYVWANAQRKAGVRLLNQQLREFRMTMAYLVKAGATLELAVLYSTQSIQYPLRPYLDDTIREMGLSKDTTLRVETVLSALRRLGERIGNDETRQLVQLLEMGAKHDSEISGRLLQALDIEKKMRDTRAERQYPKIQQRNDMISLGMLEAPMEILLIVSMMSFISNPALLQGIFH